MRSYRATVTLSLKIDTPNFILDPPCNIHFVINGKLKNKVYINLIKVEIRMIDLIFSFASGILQMNLRDPHDIPFALPLVFCAVLGFVMAFILLQFIGNEQKQDKNEED